jgi:nitroreductase
MKSLDQLLQQRRSIREYDADRSVPQEYIEEILKALIEAPSWKNKQTGRYHIVTSANMRDRLIECLAPQNRTRVNGAPVLIVTSYVKNVVGFNDAGEPSNELGNGWGIYDLGLQNSILLLKATDLGLGSLVLGLRDADAIRSLLQIPENEIIVSVIAIGYKANEAKRPNRKEISEISKFY